MSTISIIGVIAAVICVAAALGYLTLRYDVTDDETILVVSGRHYADDSGRPLPFDIVHDGTYLKFPVIEQARPFSLAPTSLEWDCIGSPAELDQTLEVTGTAVVAPARDEDSLRTAIERFVGFEQTYIPRIAANSIGTTFQRHLESIPERLARNPDGDWVDDIADHAADELATYGLRLVELRVDDVTDHGD